ncbi:hypothetical protein Pelo_9786 [Pelomyxa schiedti]|nr:hypothetical protein Pelo_9786 [Pelomyxa schiedti]
MVECEYGVTCPSCSVFVDSHLLRLLGEDKYRLFNELCSSKALTVCFELTNYSDEIRAPHYLGFTVQYRCPKCKKFTCVACLKLANMCTCANVDPALVARYKKEVQGHLPMCRSQQIPVRERVRTVSLRGQQTYTIYYHLDDTIDVLRCLFERDHPDIPCYMQKLVFSGQEMPSNKPLRAFGLSASTTMHLILLSTAQQMPPRDPNSRPTPATGGDASLIGKPCPQCRTVGVHYRDHHCHHIQCLCGYNYCYVCLGAYEGYPAKCKNGCKLWCSRQCDCPVCPDCTDNFKCTVVICQTCISRLVWIVMDPATTMCPYCGKDCPTKLVCACGLIFYCSAECQLHDWDSHKEICPTSVIRIRFGKKVAETINRGEEKF